MNEEWKDIIEYEGLYQISNLGRLKRFYKNGNFRIIKPLKDSIGYMMYGLSKNSKFKQFKIHRLVAIYFIPNLNNYPEVNHIDGNKDNYSIDNLEWCTRSQNMKHAHSLGLIFVNKATDIIKIITEDKKLIIKKMKDKKFTLKEIACLCDVNISTISKVLNNPLENIK